MKDAILYLECYSGISGDMTVAALLDLGADEKELRRVLDSLELPEFQIQIGKVKKNGILATDFQVILDSPEKRHGKHTHAHEEGEHVHVHRNLEDVYAILERADTSDAVKARAKEMFRLVAEAEAAVHGLPLEQVHFHEVGAVDSIVDFLAAAFCLEDLGAQDVVVSTLFEGQGMIRCQHGRIPVPAPAAAQIASSHHLAMQVTDVQGELVTPTGAAIAAASRTRDCLPEHFLIRRIGIGAGKRDYDAPNILRAMWVEER
ncbi:LarC family nickel insertion protein [Hominifimenecus sp. rT4P-3]|uniref:LarC family nickel insertion protein n=1 Tax=Hominifimenecus sp. rT4P-3 TaxID=3242979 RepID=UPI003DA1F0BA